MTLKLLLEFITSYWYLLYLGLILSMVYIVRTFSWDPELVWKLSVSILGVAIIIILVVIIEYFGNTCPMCRVIPVSNGHPIITAPY